MRVASELSGVLLLLEVATRIDCLSAGEERKKNNVVYGTASPEDRPESGNREWDGILSRSERPSS